MPTKTELRAKLEALLREEGASFGSDALAGELVDVIERGDVLRLDPEEPELPRRIVCAVWNPGSETECTVLSEKVDPPASGRFLEIGPLLPRVNDILRAMVAAYNERQEIAEIEADVDNRISDRLGALCQRETDAKVAAGVQVERERCAGILQALCEAIEAMTGPSLPAWALWRYLDLACQEVRSGKPVPELVSKDAEPSPGWPERLSAILRGLYVVTAATGASRPITEAEAREAARRWEAEPLQAIRIGQASAVLTWVKENRHVHPVGKLLDEAINAYRILTGKES